MPRLVSPEALKMMAAEKEVNIAELRDRVALVAFEQLMVGTTSQELASKTKVMSETIAKLNAVLAFDFAEAFMRERYERECIARSGMKANIPDHLGQLNL